MKNTTKVTHLSILRLILCLIGLVCNLLILCEIFEDETD